MTDITDDNPLAVPVDAVLDKLDHGNNWIQRSWENHEGMCLHQGIRLCEVRKGDAYLIEQVAERQGWGTDFNDEDGTTFDDVKQRLVEHREVFPHELEETFGPQWRSIVTLVRQAAQLAGQEAEALVAARAAGAAAWNAARAVARAVARDAAWNAARNAARNAAWNAARDAAGAAAGAVVVRDLIGQHGFTQEHYDTLVGPWESVMGTEATR